MEETKTASAGLKHYHNLGNIKDWVKNEDQQKIYGFYLKKLEDARSQRTKNRVELDNNNYENDYELNKRAVNSYLFPKANSDDVRVVTTTTEKKIEVVENELMAINFQPEITAYDRDDNEMKSLGQDFTDVTNRTNRIERDDKIWRFVIRELLSQRAVFIDELDAWHTINRKNYNRIDEFGGEQPSSFSDNFVTFRRPEKRILSGLQVYLGDDSIPWFDFQKQPYIIKYFKKSYDSARAQWGQYKNFQYVKPGTPMNSNQPFGYRMNSLRENEVEELHYINPYDNEFMVILNGVFMWDKPIPCPWTITPDRRYMTEMVALKLISLDYAYGRPLTASSKMIQSLQDETLRLLIRKFRQAVTPPMGTKLKKIFSSDIWQAGAITQGIKKDDIEILNPENKGVTNAEFQMMNTFNQITEEAIGTPASAQGIEQKGEQTATEIVNQQRRFIKNLGQAVLSLMYIKEQMTYQRIYNLGENYTKPVKNKYNPLTEKMESIYRKFTINDGTFENGQRGKKVVQFIDRDLEPVEKSALYELEKREELAGRPTRYRFINSKKLDVFSLVFDVNINQKEREGSSLEKVLFRDKLNQAVAISQITQRPLNSDEIIDNFEFTWRAKNIFQKKAMTNNMTDEQKSLQNRINGLEAEGQSMAADQMKESTQSQMNNPSINKMQSNV